MSNRRPVHCLWIALLVMVSCALSWSGSSPCLAQNPATPAADVEIPTADVEATTPPPKQDATPDELAPTLPTDEDEEFFELLKLFADTLDQVERNYVQQVSRRELMEAAIRGLLGKLDQYSNYIPPDELEQFRTGVESEFGGIGIRVGMVDDKLTVITPLVETPAYRAGILAGDQIVKIGDESTEGMSLDDAIRRMKGKVDSVLRLTVRHLHDGSEDTVSMIRETVRVETVLGYRRNQDNGWDFMYDADQRIGYIRVTSFSRQTHQDLREALRLLTENELRGLILDLRFNPGGLLSSAIEVSDLFLSEGTIVSTEGRNIPSKTWNATDDGTYEGFDMAVLVNRFSASASEIVAASLQDHQRAVVVGERTWGKGSVQNIIELENGRSALKLTTAGYYRPSGKNIQRNEGADEAEDWGVRPADGYTVKLTPDETRQLLDLQRERDVVVDPNQQREPPTPSSFVDRQLQRALEYLGEQLAQR